MEIRMTAKRKRVGGGGYWVKRKKDSRTWTTVQWLWGWGGIRGKNAITKRNEEVCGPAKRPSESGLNAPGGRESDSWADGFPSSPVWRGKRTELGEINSPQSPAAVNSCWLTLTQMPILRQLIYNELPSERHFLYVSFDRKSWIKWFWSSQNCLGTQTQTNKKEYLQIKRTMKEMPFSFLAYRSGYQMWILERVLLMAV